MRIATTSKTGRRRILAIDFRRTVLTCHLHPSRKMMPLGSAAQGIYMLADGTHSGTACCWDFGNVSTDPKKYGVMNTLFFGKAFWGKGAGNGPWMMADFEAGVWAGGTKVGDPGWGSLNDAHPANNNNPSLAVPFAMGILFVCVVDPTAEGQAGCHGPLATPRVRA